MGLYNMIFGTHPTAPLVLMLLEKDPSYFSRFRDAWIEKLEDGTLRLAVYTRNGGGNRGHYSETPATPAGPNCDCTGCVAQYRLPSHELYLSDEDDAYDSTYATFYFKVPDDAEETFRKLAAAQGISVPDGWGLERIALQPVNMSERWDAALQSLQESSR